MPGAARSVWKLSLGERQGWLLLIVLAVRSR
jgi:hypothetical protein